MKIPQGNNILEYIQKQGQTVIAPCNGKGICGKCHITINDNPEPNKQEIKLLSEIERNKGIRLACTRVSDSNTIIENLFDVESYNIIDSYEDNFDKNPYLVSNQINDSFNIVRGTVEIDHKDHPNTYGVAVDIGTTTVAILLFNLHTQVPIESVNFLNPQSTYGSDVISRIQFASTKEQLDILTSLITTKIDQEIIQLLVKNGINKNDLYEVVISANTIMNHLLLNVDPTSMAQAPYESSFLNTVIRDYNKIFASDIPATVTIIGGLDSYVGGDIVSGIYSQNIHKEDTYNILVDLGTNGEIIIGNNEMLYGSSTAAGPAFEGVNIHHGVGAINGAICKYTFDKKPETIKHKEAIGICGSGIIDIVSELYNHNFINDSGYMKDPYSITDSIEFLPKDVREVQLAKSAVRAGIEVLLEEANLTLNDINTLYLAGGFGKHVDIDNLYNIGIIPLEFKSKTKIIGNSSLAGAVKYLFSPLNNEIENIQQNKTIVNLGTSKRFQDLFIDYISFKK